MLRLLTTTCLAMGFVMMLSWGWILGPRPSANAPRAKVRDYAIRSSAYVGVLMGTLVASGVGALLIMKRSREEFQSQAMNNLKDLVEGSLKDHAKTRREASDEP